jgi:TRAP-type mannitol/chloroaromatic compound transport system substrate-binding protein
MLRAAVVLLFLLLLPSAAHAEKRVALVIGNSSYRYAGELANPKNDATDMAAALRTHGFQVIDGFDLNKTALERKIREFANALQGAEVGVFFYAGHGLQVSGQNYIVPTDAQLTTVAALELEVTRFEAVQRIMESEDRTNILFFDACRDNPLARNLQQAMGTRSTAIGRGLAPVQSGYGTLISYSTQPGNVALDGSGRNSPFTGALIRHLSSSNEEIMGLLRDVRNDVMRETQRRQVPWEHTALTGRFYFNTLAMRPAPGAPPPQAPATVTAPPPTRDDSATIPTAKWKLQDTWPAKMATTLPLFHKRVSELSGGKIQVDMLPAGAVVPAFQLFDAVSASVLDLGYGTGGYGYGKHRALALMAAVPFGFTVRDHLAFRQRTDTKAAFDELITGILKLNVVALPCGAFGRSGEFWLNRPLQSKSDLVGKKLRFVGLSLDIYTKLGSAVNVLPGGEIISAIERGLIDGGQFINPTNDLELGFADVLKHYYYPSSVMPAYILDLYVNKGKWDAMPPAGRQIIERACAEAVDAMITEQERLDREALAELARRGVNVARVPTTIERDLYVASEKVLTEYRRDSSFDRVMKIVDQMRARTLASRLR